MSDAAGVSVVLRGLRLTAGRIRSSGPAMGSKAPRGALNARKAIEEPFSDPAHPNRSVIAPGALQRQLCSMRKVKHAFINHIVLMLVQKSRNG